MAKVTDMRAQNPYSGYGIRGYSYVPGEASVGAAPVLDQFLQAPQQNQGGYYNPNQPPQYDYAAYNAALADWNEKRAQAQLASGFGPDGKPLAPEFVSMIDPSTGRLRDEYSIEATLLDPESISGYSQFEKFATGTGPSEYAQEAQKGLDLKTALERDRASAEAAGAAAQARSQLAMRGGMGSGARERVASQAARQGLMGRQEARQAQLLGTADINIQDALSRQQALQGFVGMGADIGQFNVNLQNQAEEFNITSALDEIGRERQFAMDAYKQKSEEWAAEKKAAAQRRASGCFAYGTEIEMEDGTHKPIQDIKLGDRVKEGGEVYALYLQSFSGTICNYNGVLVTRDHAVLDTDGVWKRVRDTKAFESRAIARVVYDISTKNHIIRSHGKTFADFAENDDFYLTDEESIRELNSRRDVSRLSS